MEKLTFEEAMEKMDEVVRQLEQGDLSLEKSMELYQEGMHLSKHCGVKLNDVETKIQTLLKENGEIVTKDLKLED